MSEALCRRRADGGRRALSLTNPEPRDLKFGATDPKAVCLFGTFRLLSSYLHHLLAVAQWAPVYIVNSSILVYRSYRSKVLVKNRILRINAIEMK